MATHRQREITDEKTRFWVAMFTNELAAVNDFRVWMDLPMISRVEVDRMKQEMPDGR